MVLCPGGEEQVVSDGKWSGWPVKATQIVR